VWVHSAAFSALISPARGGAVEEYTVFGDRINYANTLTRRREAYLDLALERGADHPAASDGGTESIHDIEEGLRLEVRPPIDHEDRALFVDRLLPGGVTLQDYAASEFWAILSWARRRCEFTVERHAGGVEVLCTVPEGRGRFEKRIRCEADGRLRVEWRWDPEAAEPGDLFATELSLAGPVRLDCAPAADEWRFEIETLAKSERGLDRTRQGESVTLRWPVELGSAAAVLTPAGR
jgi:hypothetical protein